MLIPDSGSVNQIRPHNSIQFAPDKIKASISYFGDDIDVLYPGKVVWYCHAQVLSSLGRFQYMSHIGLGCISWWSGVLHTLKGWKTSTSHAPIAAVLQCLVVVICLAIRPSGKGDCRQQIDASWSSLYAAGRWYATRMEVVWWQLGDSRGYWGCWW